MSMNEEDLVEKRLIKYCYGDKGILRYYLKIYDEFMNEFRDICFIDDIFEDNNQISFFLFINKIVNIEDNKWIQEKYSLLNINNTHTFSIQSFKN